MNIGILSLVTFFPLVGFVIILFLREEQREVIRWVALVTSLLTFVISLVALSLFTVGEPGLQLVERLPWLSLGNVNSFYFLGVDGLSILLLLLTTFLTPIAILSAWQAIREGVRSFMLFFLLMETGITGVFLAQDLVLFFLFWEFSLVPMYFLIGIWGAERRVYAAIKFFLYTLIGSILMLLGIMWLGLTQGSFALPDLVAKGGLAAGAQFWLFLAFAIAFAIKVPMWPLHTWLPDAHVEAPTAGSVILAALMLKQGAYGLLRFNLALFPQATLRLAPWMAGLAVVGILYGAAVAYAQSDMKKLVAYSSVSHLGFVVLGLFALNQQGISGAILQMVNHGLSTGALFLLVGVIYDRIHTHEMAFMGGLWKPMVMYGGMAIFFVLSSVGLPGLNGFVGEFTILLGAFGSQVLASPWFAGLATAGVILAAIYLLIMVQKVFFGPVTRPANQTLSDLNWREVLTLVPLMAVILWIGIYPRPFFDLINPSVQQLASALQTAMLAMH